MEIVHWMGSLASRHGPIKIKGLGLRRGELLALLLAIAATLQNVSLTLGPLA